MSEREKQRTPDQGSATDEIWNDRGRLGPLGEEELAEDERVAREVGEEEAADEAFVRRRDAALLSGLASGDLGDPTEAGKAGQGIGAPLDPALGQREREELSVPDHDQPGAPG